MDQLDLARVQFATTSVYHFFFVPITMGLAVLVAVLHTRWYRKGTPELRRVTRFFGGLMLISISVGVVTGLVQEFQFGTRACPTDHVCRARIDTVGADSSRFD